MLMVRTLWQLPDDAGTTTQHLVLGAELLQSLSITGDRPTTTEELHACGLANLPPDPSRQAVLIRAALIDGDVNDPEATTEELLVWPSE